jgi:hypothetical protein
MQMIPRRESLHLAETRMIESARKDKVTIEPPLPRRHLRKRHPHLESDPSFLRQNTHRTNRANEPDDRVEEFKDLRIFPAEMFRQGVPAAGVRLILVREKACAFRATPQRRTFARSE